MKLNYLGSSLIAITLIWGHTQPVDAAVAVLFGGAKYSAKIMKECLKVPLPPQLKAACLVLDPAPVPSIEEIGFEIKYDPSKIRIIPERSGFLCELSSNGDCPPVPLVDSGQLINLGDPRENTNFNLYVTSDTVTLYHDLRNNPTPPIDREFNFFGLAFEPLVDFNQISESDFVQQVNSPAQFCTVSGERTTCGVPVPEPSTILGSLVAAIGAASTLKRKLKPSQSPDKETTKID
ncbi:PEP-CTERM sorting domain-containing protein [Limnofasciculus baicalensis]|uniref:PEP-CTERM sorting domain-containing protein n=1 Tax=Limnofasciculus baicalensis BBK-W-15 TaxID=2699891 RepID=A0AAE3GV15_9CYAN|nr:PEP-CTERM sorting domain-containing protein [Limnofasciculus baicalensis]MCP2731210.1 PEP-CTERM sorting domain-containing protein [Limnofasciculus baicalensis BBK-W-15]